MYVCTMYDIRGNIPNSIEYVIQWMLCHCLLPNISIKWRLKTWHSTENNNQDSSCPMIFLDFIYSPFRSCIWFNQRWSAVALFKFKIRNALAKLYLGSDLTVLVRNFILVKESSYMIICFMEKAGNWFDKKSKQKCF